MLKEKAQAAPKELLRRGLLTGAKKMKGQLRDAAEGGRREDTEAERVQDTARMGARLAVDKLGRLALGKKKARSWSGEAVPGTGESQTGSNTPTPGTQADPSTLHDGTEFVRIKTRDAVHDVPTEGYGRANLSGADQPMVKTKDAYIHRQAVAKNQQHKGTAPQAKEHIRVDQSPPSQPTIRTKGNDIRQYGIGSEKVGRGVIPGQISKDSPTHPSQALERGRQSFVREHQVATQRTESQDMGGMASTPTDRKSTAGVSSPASQSGPVRAEMRSTKKTVRDTHDSGKRPVKTARSERGPARKPGHQK